MQKQVCTTQEHQKRNHANRAKRKQIPCQDPASTSPWGSAGNVGWGLWRGRSYSRFRRTHTSGVLTRSLWTRCSYTPCVGSLFSRYPSHPAWSLRGSSQMPCVGSLFSHALRGLVVLAVSVTPGVVSSWLFPHALRGFVVLTRLAWARCSCGIRHAHRGLFAALLTRLAWACCSRGVVVAAPVTGIER